MTHKIITIIPLQPEMQRCYGVGYKPGDSGCPQREDCARHITTQHVDEPFGVQNWYRLCDYRNDGYTLKLELEYEVTE